MNREQVFLAVLTGVVTRALPNGLVHLLADGGIDYGKIIKTANSVTDAVMRQHVDLDVKPDSRPTWGETQRLLVELESVQTIAEQHRTTAMRLQAEVDRLKEQAKDDLENDRDLAAKLNRELTESRTNFMEAYRKIEAKGFKILEIEEEIKRLERELQASNQAVAAAGTRPTWHHLREVEKELQNAKIGLKAVADVVMKRDATIGNLQESNDDMRSEIDDFINANNRLQAEVDRLQGKEREVVALDEAMQTIQLERKIAKELLTKIQNLQTDKDALRKAVEDGAMEIERLRNTLKGVEQIVAMKPEDVEMLAKYAQGGCGWVPNMLDNDKPRLFRDPAEIKLVGDPDVRDGKVYSVGIVSEEIWPMTVPEVVPVDIKNDLSSAVANSTEGQRVVVEDLEATVELDPVELDPDEWVTQDVVYGRRCDQFRIFHRDVPGVWQNCIPGSIGSMGYRHGHPINGGVIEFRCRRKDLPVVEVKGAPVVATEEDPEEYVLINDPAHKLRRSDEFCAVSVFNQKGQDYLQYEGGGWVPPYDSMIGESISEWSNLVYRCKRKDLPVNPPAAESQS